MPKVQAMKLMALTPLRKSPKIVPKIISKGIQRISVDETDLGDLSGRRKTE